MKIKKVFNNNVVLTENDQQQEMVVMGKGLAFQKKVGQPIELEKVEKKFVLENQGVSDKLADLLVDTPDEYLKLSHRILDYAKSHLPYKVDDYLYVALTDHLHFAVSRQKEGVEFKNLILWEIRKYYKKEFQVALKALDFIEEATGVRFPEDEAGLIALHLINSQLYGDNLDAAIQVKVVNNILNIVTYHFGMKLDEDSINYERFLTHLRFFAMRFLRKETEKESFGDEFLFEQVKKKYEQAYLCSEKIAAYVSKTYEWDISNDEKIYLTLHIHRVTNREAWVEK